MPLFFEDYQALEIGHAWQSGTQVVSPEDVRRFADWTGDTNPIHLDQVYAQASSYEGRIVHGYLTIAMAAGLVYRLGLDEVASHAILQTNWKLVKALRPGGAISVTLTLTGCRESRSNPDFGIVSRRYDVLDRDGDTIAIGEVTMLIFKRAKIRSPDEA